jgi:hypothetical protein
MAEGEKDQCSMTSDQWADTGAGHEEAREDVKRRPTIGGTKDILDLRPEEFEERETGSFIFENEWQSFRTRQNRELELTSAKHTYERPGRYIVAVKVIDIFGNDTMTLVPVVVG